MPRLPSPHASSHARSDRRARAFLVFALRAEASPYDPVRDPGRRLAARTGRGRSTSDSTGSSALGVDVVRFNLHWDQIAAKRPAQPASHLDPAYDWADADVLLSGLRARGIARGRDARRHAALGERRPRAELRADERDARSPTSPYAAATRYRWVRRWLIWNEPNQTAGSARRRPRTYVQQLLNPAYAALKRANRANLVAGGVTAPRGSTGGVSPVDWIRGMRRRARAARRVRAPSVSVEPRVETPFVRRLQRTATTITMATLERLLARGRSARSARSGSG